MIGSTDLIGLRTRLAKLTEIVERPAEAPIVAGPSHPPWTDADAALAPVPRYVSPDEMLPPSKRGEAIAWLRATLAYGPVLAKEVYARAAVAGIAKRTLQRAKQRLHVRSEVDRRAIPKRWRWRLPEPEANE